MAASGLMLALFLVTALRRLHFPFDLEWVEDGNLQELLRVTRHQPLYVAPTLDYVPYLYAPLFFWLAALLAKVVGTGFAAMRLLSIAATLGVVAGLFALVYLEFPEPAAQAGAARGRHIPRLLAATLAVGFFMCAYPVTASFFDFGRVDMVCLCFAMLALLAGRRGYPVLAALLWVCSFQTKQGVLPVALLALSFEWQRPRRILAGLGTFALVAGASVAWLNHTSNGWYGRYIFGMAGGFPLTARRLFFFLPDGIVLPFGLAAALALAALWLTPPDWRSRITGFYIAAGLGMLLFTWYISAHLGASANSILPAYLYLAIAAGLAVGRMYERLDQSDFAGASALQALVLVAAILQIAMHLYTPSQYQPGSIYQGQTAALVNEVRKLPGDVLVFDHAEYAVMAGHHEFANGEAAIAMILVKHGQISEGLRRQYLDAVHQHRFSAIALDDEPGQFRFWIAPDLMNDYPVKVELVPGQTFDMTAHPVLLYMPCAGAGNVDPRKLFPDHLIDETRCPAQ